MPTINKLIFSWRQWLNRNQTFHKKELDEMEDHLIEEIDYLVKQENLTEEEAFHKATTEMGKREVLDKDFLKTKSTALKLILWFRTNSFYTGISLLILIFSIGYFTGWYPVFKENQLLRDISSGYKKVYKGNFVPFKVSRRISFQENKNQVINKPMVSYFNEDQNGLHKISKLAFDDAGYAYYIKTNGGNESLYCLAPDRKTHWMKKDVNAIDMIVLKEGVLLKAWCQNKHQLLFYNKDGKFKWKADGEQPAIGPDGMIYAFKTDEKIFFSCDSNGKIRWEYQLAKNLGNNMTFEDNDACGGVFFDDYNSVFLITSTPFDSLHLFQLINNSKLVFEEEYPISQYSNLPLMDSDYLSQLFGKTFKKQFILFHNKTEKDVNENIISAFYVDGGKKWSYSELPGKFLNVSNMNGPNESILILYCKTSNNELFVQSISSDGKLLWEKKTFESSQSDEDFQTTNLVQDGSGNTYFGIISTEDFSQKIVSFDVEGNLRWKIDLDNKESYKSLAQIRNSYSMLNKRFNSKESSYNEFGSLFKLTYEPNGVLLFQNTLDKNYLIIQDESMKIVKFGGLDANYQ